MILLVIETGVALIEWLTVASRRLALEILLARTVKVNPMMNNCARSIR
jgi:hypothetical protein